jgi:hypothetical protein
VIQIFSILIGLFIVALEYPAPFMKGTGLYRSLVARVVLLLFQTFFAIIFYQVRLPCLIPRHHRRMTEAVPSRRRERMELFGRLPPSFATPAP